MVGRVVDGVDIRVVGEVASWVVGRVAGTTAGRAAGSTEIDLVGGATDLSVELGGGSVCTVA